MAAPTPPNSWQEPPAMPSCYRHANSPAGVKCQRCDRPICPQCMHTASVGFHCPECSQKGAQKEYRGAVSLQSQPLLTYALIAINVAVFVAGVIMSGSSALDSGSDLIVDYGLIAKFHGVPVGVGQGEWYRIFTSGFLHYGIFHLAFNMWALYILGSAIERGFGRARFATIYFVALVSGALGALILSPGSLTAGASGAIFGLMGGLVGAQRAQGVPIRQSPVFGILLINLLLTFGIPNISIGGHIGGLIGGFIVGSLLVMVPAKIEGPSHRPGPKLSQGDVGALAVCTALGVATFIGALVFYA